MGAGASKDELVYMAVQRGDANGVRALRQQGASLEWRDSKGRTPLMLACSRPEAFEAAHVLLQLGASINVASKGPEGGTPLHYAARKRLTRTLEMLLNFGADPLLRNDVGKSALDIARDQNNSQMVRLIESRVALFAAKMSQHFLSNAILKMLVPQWVSREVWVAVLPVAKGVQQFQLAVHADYGAGIPLQLINLHGHLIVLTKQETEDPKVVIQNSGTGEKLKFGAPRPPNPVLVTNFYNACMGIPVVPQAPPGASQRPYGAVPVAAGPAGFPPPPPPAQAPGVAGVQPAKGEGLPTADPAPPTNLGSFQDLGIDEEEAMRRAIEESKKTASQPTTSDLNGWGGPSGPPAQPSYGGWGADEPAAPAATVAAAGAAAAAAGAGAAAAGRASSSSGGAGPTSAPAPESAPVAATQAPPPPPPSQPATGAPAAAAASVLGESGSTEAPSAPPLPSSSLYPNIDTTPVSIDYGAVDLLSAAPSAAAPPPEPTAVLNPAYNEERMNAELRKAESKKGGGQCVICWDAPADAVCVPCGHMAGCMECLTEVKGNSWGCPVCRAEIDKVIKVFQV